MPKLIWKPLHLCFLSSPPPTSTTPAADDPNPPSILLINNLNLLLNHHSSSTSTSTSDQSLNYDFTPDSPLPDLTAVFASPRFFFSSPGQSKAITESSSDDSTKTKEDNHENATTTTTTTTTNTTRFLNKENYETTTPTSSRFLDEENVVKRYLKSPDPYVDFKRSMEEMLDAAASKEDGGDFLISGGYEFLHKLLLSYLSLNRVETHRFIIKAFADILVSLLSDCHRVC